MHLGRDDLNHSQLYFQTVYVRIIFKRLVVTLTLVGQTYGPQQDGHLEFGQMFYLVLCADDPLQSTLHFHMICSRFFW